MKQEEEPWIDHLKQRVNEYEKPLPGNDWNHFQTEFFTPYLHKRRRMKTMRIAAVFFLIFIPFATTFYFLQTEKHKASSPVVSLPVNPEKPDVPLNKNDAFQKVQKRRVQEKR